MKERVKQTKTPSESPVKLSTAPGLPSIEMHPTSPTKLNSSGKTLKSSSVNGSIKSNTSNNTNALPVKPVTSSLPVNSSGYASSPGTSPEEAMQSPREPPPHISMLNQKAPGSSSKSLRMKGKEYFFETVRFLDELVAVSHALTAKYGQKEEYSKSKLLLLTIVVLLLYLTNR